jgi:protein TonB
MTAWAVPHAAAQQDGIATQKSADSSGASKQRKKPEKIYSIGGDVTPPKLLSTPDPVNGKDLSRKTKSAGVAVVQFVVNSEGKPERVHIIRSAGKDLDQKVIEAVEQYRFEPAKRKGQPVAVVLTIESQFHLYK